MIREEFDMEMLVMRLWRKVLCCLVPLVFLLGPATGAASAAKADPVGDFEGHVDVGGHRLFVRCTGQGSPTVILDAGLAVSSDTWSLVQPEVAKFTRVCSYDRAFLGQSDPGPAPRTSQMIVDDLRALLQNAGIPGPYVLVGWSFGGFNMQLMARQDGGRSVIGMVLIDATPVQWIEVSDRLGRPVPAPGQTPEQVDLRASAAQVLSAPPFPDIPLAVLTHGVAMPDPVVEQAWQELQAWHAQLSPRGELIVAEGARHRIHIDRPDLVIDAIRRVVEAARADLRPGRGCGDAQHFHERKVECKQLMAA